MYRFAAALLITISFFSSCINFKLCHPVSFMPETFIVAHRGAWKKMQHPENSIASLEQAFKNGYHATEFDIHMTADDSLVINHDPDYYGMPIETNTYANLNKRKLENGEDLPLLANFFKKSLEKKNNTQLIAEIKPSTISIERGRKIADKVVALANQFQLGNKIAYISFDINILQQIVQIQPTAHTQYLEGNLSPDSLHQMGISGLNYHYSVYQKNESWIQEAKKRNMLLGSWTVNDREVMKWLIDKDFDYITTNEPEILYNVLYQKAVKK